MTYNALIVRKDDAGTATRAVETRDTDELPEGELTVRVSHSSLNYKDALSATGNPGVTRKYPHQPGIDSVGTVESSRSERFAPGAKVIVFGRDLGMNTAGGFGEYIRVPAEWAIPLPDALAPADAMAIGTAGFTAAMAIEEVTAFAPDDGEILVTGATGGVGSVAVTLLSQLGYRVCAVTGKTEEHDYLTHLGATRIIDRETATKGYDKPILSTEWAGVIDNVGGPILARAVKATRPGAVVASCGNAASIDLPLNVFPFILRGVRLIGINSPACPNEQRIALWEKLAGPWRPRTLGDIVREVSLEDLSDAIDAMLAGKIRGRVVVTHQVFSK